MSLLIKLVYIFHTKWKLQVIWQRYVESRLNKWWYNKSNKNGHCQSDSNCILLIHRSPIYPLQVFCSKSNILYPKKLYRVYKGLRLNLKYYLFLNKNCSKEGFLRWKEKEIGLQIFIQTNSVITNSMGPSVYVCYNRKLVITVKICVVK